jgi:hypothetical protein
MIIPSYIINQINNENNKNDKNLKNKSKKIYFIQEKNENELIISKKIKKIKKYNYFFNPIINDYLLNTAKISSEIDIIKKVNEIKNINNIMISRYEHPLMYQNFFSFFQNLKDKPKEFIKNILESYNYLLNSIGILKENKICYFNINNFSVYFNRYSNPILFDFKDSIYYEDINIKNQLLNITINKNSNQLYPLEIEMLSYMNHNNSVSLSKHNIEDIYESYIEKIKILLSGVIYEDEVVFHNNCIKLLLKYENKSKDEIIGIIHNEEYIKSWDNFGLSVLYIELLNDYYSSKDLLNENQRKFYNYFCKSLFLNIDMNPSKRMNLEKTREHMEELYFIDIDWINFLM